MNEQMKPSIDMLLKVLNIHLSFCYITKFKNLGLRI
jgi:hypothetical protein